MGPRGKKTVVFAEKLTESNEYDEDEAIAKAPAAKATGQDAGKSSGKGEENRFKHFLDPIRDLAVNWNVDIANELEQYLNELEMIEISFDGGETTLNFAEAALLIQGSTCVYSRKVEYLYKLVFNVLDIIANRQKKADAMLAADPDSEFPAEPEFIALDDIKEAKASAIDMVEKDDGEFEQDDALTNKRTSLLMMQINLEGSDVENSDPNKDFRLASASVHESGALLLESRFNQLLDCNLEAIASDTPTSNTLEVPEMLRDSDEAMGEANGGDGAGDDAAAIDHGHEEMETYDAPDYAGPEGDDGGDDDDDWDAFQEPLPEGSVNLPRGSEPSQAHLKPASSASPWAMLDPHDASGANPRPFRRGKTSRRPKKESTQGYEPRANLGGLQTRSIKLPAFQDFMPLFIEQRNKILKEKLQAARLRKEKASEVTKEDLDRLAMQVDLDDDYDVVDPDYGDGGGGGDDGGWDAPDDGDDDAGLPPMLGEGDVAYGTPGGSRAYPESTEENAGSVLAWQGGEAYEDMCRKYVERYLKGVENFVHQSGLEARVGEWQEKLAPKLEAEEKREVFDIHSYGDRVKTLVSKQSTNKEVPFGKAVAGLQQFDVCRAFLAALQLANDGNVEISLKDNLDNSTIRLKLLHNESRHTAMVEEYVAPSILSARKKKLKKPEAGPTTGLGQVIESMPAPVRLVLPGGDDEGEATQESQAPTQDKGGKRSAEGTPGRRKAGKKNKENVSAQ